MSEHTAENDAPSGRGDWTPVECSCRRWHSSTVCPDRKNTRGIPSKKNPPWWPTVEQKRHADAGCAHPDTCHIPPVVGQP